MNPRNQAKSDEAAKVAAAQAALWGRDDIFFAPVRHHSPACAWHLSQLIQEVRPAAVLIEAPHDCEALIPLCLAPETEAPFAIYCASERKNNAAASDSAEPAVLRAAAFYPLCDYSPELVALRDGAAADAELRFIDLPSSDKAWLGAPGGAGEDGEPADDRLVASLLDENHLAHSRYLSALAAKAGCRDHNELWDHLFELRPFDAGWRGFFEEVLAYCLMARLDYDPEALEVEGNLPRERFMAARIRAARTSVTGPIVVLTGGFHTPGLIELLAAGAEDGSETEPAGEHAGYLVRYSFDRLDALNGYGAGMPSPAYYQMLWERLPNRDAAAGPDPWTETAAQLFVALAQDSRAEGKAQWLSTAEAQSALGQASALAALRGHPGPGREDTLDAVRSCFVKGAIDEEGQLLMAEVRRMLRGERMGNIPASAGSPPLVEDARRRAVQLRLKIDSTSPSTGKLDLYRKPRHRQASRFFHAMSYLGTTFARLEGGPDFTSGRDLDLLFEEWKYAWSPSVEASLIDAAVNGETVEAAVLTRLLEKQRRLERDGQGRSARAAVRLLLKACRMGLQDRLPRLFDLIGQAIAEDPEFGSAVAATQELLLLWQSREPLGVQHLSEVPGLLKTGYDRAVYLLPDLGRAQDSAARQAAEDLLVLRDILISAQSLDPVLLDRNLFHEALLRMVAQPDAAPFLAGAGGALLYLEGRCDATALESRLSGTLAGALADIPAQVAFLAGIMAVSRELLWRLPGLLARLNDIFADWDGDEFLTFLPQLRLAFTALTPRECDQVAQAVAGLNGAAPQDIGGLVSYEVDEHELLHNLALEQRLKQALARDGLAAWAEAPAKQPEPSP